MAVSLSGCTALENVDGLKGLTNLVSIRIGDCTKLSHSTLRELRAALPKTVFFLSAPNINREKDVSVPNK